MSSILLALLNVIIRIMCFYDEFVAKSFFFSFALCFCLRVDGRLDEMSLRVA